MLKIRSKKILQLLRFNRSNLLPQALEQVASKSLMIQNFNFVISSNHISGDKKQRSPFHIYLNSMSKILNKYFTTLKSFLSDQKKLNQSAISTVAASNDSWVFQ